jgi:hypothetical protein
MKLVNGYTGKTGEQRRVLMMQYRAHHAHVKPNGETIRVESGFTTQWEDGVYRTPEGYECCSWCGKWHMGKAEKS